MHEKQVGLSMDNKNIFINDMQQSTVIPFAYRF
jgi:hypothetical protein